MTEIPAVDSPPSGAHHVEQVMGMAVSIDIRDNHATAGMIQSVVDWLHHVDDTFSTHKLDSPVSRLGRGEISLDEAGDEIRGVLKFCEIMRIETDGAFDVFEVPAPNGSRLDPSGLVKGWAVERAADLLGSQGAENFCINAGGDIALRGNPAPGLPWRVGIRHPADPVALALVVESAGPLGLATSGTYERGDHIVDPRTHQPTTKIASATVVGPDLTIADAYATAVFVLGVDGIAWIETRPGYEAYVIGWDEQTKWSSGFGAYRS